MAKKLYQFKSDKYKKSRGGFSRLLKLSCEKCRNHLAFYQKDGPGPLKRLYFDRLLDHTTSVLSKKVLVCSNCKTIIGTYYIYLKEKRQAYRLYQNVVVKKITKNS